jgi:hypothetical protein
VFIQNKNFLKPLPLTPHLQFVGCKCLLVHLFLKKSVCRALTNCDALKSRTLVKNEGLPEQLDAPIATEVRAIAVSAAADNQQK